MMLKDEERGRYLFGVEEAENSNGQLGEKDQCKAEGELETEQIGFHSEDVRCGFRLNNLSTDANSSCGIGSVSSVSFTVFRRRMFSLKAPMQPQKVMKNMTTPTTIRMTAGSIRNVSRTVSGTKTGEKDRPSFRDPSSIPAGCDR